MTKFLLIVWLGWGQSQTLTIETFDTQEECEAVRTAVYAATQQHFDWHRCIPYTFEVAQ